MIERTAIQIQRDVLFAMLIRELKTRFGGLKFGYAWMLVEPFMHVALFASIFYFRGMEMYPGVPTPLFILGGIVPWLCFTKCVNAGSAAVNANRGLFNYRQVRPFDAVLARVTLEFIVFLASLFALMALFAWVGITEEFHSFLYFMLVLALFFIFCMGLALILCVIGELYPEAANFIPQLVRPLYFMSGIFFSLEHIPEKYHAYLAWNPMLHFIEQFRLVCFESYKGFFADLEYVVILSVCTLFFGLLVYRLNWVELLRTK